MKELICDNANQNWGWNEHLQLKYSNSKQRLVHSSPYYHIPVHLFHPYFSLMKIPHNKEDLNMWSCLGRRIVIPALSPVFVCSKQKGKNYTWPLATAIIVTTAGIQGKHTVLFCSCSTFDKTTASCYQGDETSPWASQYSSKQDLPSNIYGPHDQIPCLFLYSLNQTFYSDLFITCPIPKVLQRLHKLEWNRWSHEFWSLRAEVFTVMDLWFQRKGNNSLA